MSQKRLTRREFIRLATLTSAGVALAACAPATTAPAPTQAPVATSAPAATQAPAATKPAATAAPVATAVPAAKYKEAPALADLVKAGKLPAVDQRLPADPKVVKPFDEVGKYGGTQRGPAYGPKIGQLDCQALRRQPLVNWETDLKTLSPNMLASYKPSEDFQVLDHDLAQGFEVSRWQPAHCR